MKEITVVVVDDSALMCAELKKIIETDAKLKVIATAKNGNQALEKIKEYKPDVVTMDVHMPVMNGIEAVKLIMKECPLPIIMVSSYTYEGAEETLEALAYGAFDYIHKPSGTVSLDLASQGRLIREKIKVAGTNANRIRVRQLGSISSRALPEVKRKQPVTPSRIGSNFMLGKMEIVGVGVSTGGPKTLLEILPQFPKDYSGAILIAQHMPAKFTKTFAKRLDSICSLQVKEAEDSEVIEKGVVYIAPGGSHMGVVKLKTNQYAIQIVNGLPDLVYKPSVDFLFNSLLEHVAHHWIGVILTGMGSDGAESLTKLRKLGGRTIAESEESCVVFGMPAKAIERGGAEFVLNINQITEKIMNLTGSS